jgi:hypothetical protein
MGGEYPKGGGRYSWGIHPSGGGGGAIFLGIPPPGANILGISSPTEGRMPQEYRPPFRIFAPHICGVVYSNDFVILSSY